MCGFPLMCTGKLMSCLGVSSSDTSASHKKNQIDNLTQSRRSSRILAEHAPLDFLWMRYALHFVYFSRAKEALHFEICLFLTRHFLLTVFGIIFVQRKGEKFHVEALRFFTFSISLFLRFL